MTGEVPNSPDRPYSREFNVPVIKKAIRRSTDAYINTLPIKCGCAQLRSLLCTDTDRYRKPISGTRKNALNILIGILYDRGRHIAAAAEVRFVRNTSTGFNI